MQKRAFTLIELAIVLTIIGLLIGGSFKVMKMMREKAKIAEAKEQVLGAKNAVIGFAMQNYYLPNSVEFQQNLSPIKDANHVLLYAVDYNLSQFDICAFTSTDSDVNNNGTLIEDVAFVIVHEGANYNMQTASSSTQINIYTQSLSQDDNTTPVNKAEPYDDIVEWVTLKQLQENIGCVNLPFRFINDKLPNAKEGIDYNATLYVENNVSEVTINCTPSPQKGISFTLPNTLSGVPTSGGEIVYDCTATENSSSNREAAQKRFVITIDPYLNKSSDLNCTNDSECASGICVDSICQTGAFDAPCIDGGDCSSGICQGGLCSGYIGDTCTVHAECLSGYCDGTQCAIIPSGGTGLPGGSSCTLNSQCASGDCLPSGKCKN